MFKELVDSLMEYVRAAQVNAEAAPEEKAATQAAEDAARERFEQLGREFAEALPAMIEAVLGPLKESMEKREGKGV